MRIEMFVGDLPLEATCAQRGAGMGWSLHTDTMMHAALVAGTVIDSTPMSQSRLCDFVC